MKLDEQEALNLRLRTDFHAFVWKAFAEIHPGKPFQDNWHIRAMCYQLTRCLNEDLTRLLITLPPRSLKSFCISSAFPAFALGRDPGLRILCTSYGDDLVRAHARLFRLIIHSQWYKAVYPETAVSSIKDSETETVTTNGGGRLGMSMGGGFTGHGGDIIIVDDPIKSQDCYFETEREKCYRTFVETLSTRVNDPATARQIVTMQRLHEDDLVGRLIAQGEWPHLDIPAIAQEAQTYRIGPKSSDVFSVEPGDLMHPNRLSEKFLHQQRIDMGSAAFSAQFLQDPIPADGEMIKRDWVRRYRGKPDPSSYERVIQSWDTAVKTGASHNYSACVTLGIRQKELHVLDAVQRKLDFHSLRVFASEHATRWRSDTVLVEDANLGSHLAVYLKQNTRVAAIAIPPKGPKEVRVSRAAAQIEAGRLFLPYVDQPWSTALEREMFAFPNAKNDDLVDALAQALNWFGTPRTSQLKSRVTIIGESGLHVLHSDF